MYRMRNGQIEVLLAHPGGPLWGNKDEGHWSVPKGEAGEGEELLAAAKREFKEETSLAPDATSFISLGSVKQKGGKVVHAWAFEGDGNPIAMKSNTFTMEWPPHSGKQKEFPENDRYEFFPLETAKRKIMESQILFLERLVDLI